MIHLSPHTLNRVEFLRRVGLVDGAPPRGVGVAIIEAIYLAAAWAESHPGESPDSAIREWRRRVAPPRSPRT